MNRSQQYLGVAQSPSLNQKVLSSRRDDSGETTTPVSRELTGVRVPLNLSASDSGACHQRVTASEPQVLRHPSDQQNNRLKSLQVKGEGSISYLGRSKGAAPFTVTKAQGVFVDIVDPLGVSYKGVINAGAASSNGLGAHVEKNYAKGRTKSPLERVIAVEEEVRTQALAKGLPLFLHTSVATHPWIIELSDYLQELAPSFMGKARVALQMTGTDAVFSAIDAARQYASISGKGDIILSCRVSYHGSPDVSFGANPRVLHRATAEQANQIFYPSYDPRFHGVVPGREDTYVEQLRHMFEATIQAKGAENFSAILLEPVSGSSAAARPASKQYVQMIAETAKKFDILLISDEVMCGLGRIGGGSIWACDKFAIEPDMITIGKSLGGGLYPISAMLVSERVHQLIVGSSRHYLHSHTYSGFPIGALAAKQALQEFSQIAKSGTTDQLGERLLGGLMTQLKDHRSMLLHGTGLMVGGLLLKNPECGHRFSGQDEQAWLVRFRASTLKNGVNVYCVNTANGPGFMCMPPLTITEEEVDLLCDRLARSIVEAAAEPSLTGAYFSNSHAS